MISLQSAHLRFRADSRLWLSVVISELRVLTWAVRLWDSASKSFLRVRDFGIFGRPCKPLRRLSKLLIFGEGHACGDLSLWGFRPPAQKRRYRGHTLPGSLGGLLAHTHRLGIILRQGIFGDQADLFALSGRDPALATIRQTKFQTFLFGSGLSAIPNLAKTSLLISCSNFGNILHPAGPAPRQPDRAVKHQLRVFVGFNFLRTCQHYDCRGHRGSHRPQHGSPACRRQR